MGSRPTKLKMPSKFCESKNDPCPSRYRSAICVPCMYLSQTGTLKPNDRRLKCLCTNPDELCVSCRSYMENKMFPPGDRLSLLQPWDSLTTAAPVNYCAQCEAERRNPYDHCVGVHSANCPILAHHLRYRNI